VAAQKRFHAETLQENKHEPATRTDILAKKAHQIAGSKHLIEQ
jgi:hypothetical protein